MVILQYPSSPQKRSDRTVGRQYQALTIMVVISVLLLGGMGTRLAQLQLINGNHNRQLADTNRIRLIPQQPERGKILDRRGRLLAGSRLSYSVFLWPIANTEDEWQPILERLATILNVPPRDIEERLEQAGYTSPFLLRIARGISPSQLTTLAELSSELNGVQVEGEAERYYPNGDLAAHVLGYTGELSDEELVHRADDGYRLGDIVGQMGVEAAFEDRLRGEWGGQQVEVDSMGQVLRILGRRDPQAGNDVQLTLDLDLQKAAEAALGDRMGAIVALDPRNGEVLAMVSRPTFDPNIFSTYISNEQWERLQSMEFPFVNRALQGYPPASTFKIVTTTAAIESGTFPIGTVLPTFPYIQAGGIEFWDWNRAGFGPLGFEGAMAFSSDTFFYQTAMAMGEKPLIQWTRRYGFGEKTGIELADEESPGLVPDEQWKLLELSEPWYQGDTINMSIGQGYMQASPLQVALMFAVPANGGYLVTPHLLKDGRSPDAWKESLDISPETLEVLKRGLRDVITYGTGTALNVSTLPPMAGKSGTAEDPPRLSHAWFGAYAPADNPEIVVVAFAENSGGGGGKVAAPMVKQVLEYYFNGKASNGPAETVDVLSD
ncbi:MAG: penicillin-binding protein 2 [Synechococcales cyanobacterium T60_A2020_003]|nr:penicillin-binding protein 2 [Synechococcales cyanobacterium T60_A2020_003]